MTVEMERAAPRGQDCRSPGAAPTLDRIEADARQLRRLAARAGELHALATCHACRKQVELALAFALRAVEADPSCAACVETLASLHQELGPQDLAAAARKRAVRLNARAPVTSYSGFLRPDGA